MNDDTFDFWVKVLADEQRGERYVLFVESFCAAFAVVCTGLMGSALVDDLRSGNVRAWVVSAACAFCLFGTLRIAQMLQRSLWRWRLIRKMRKCIIRFRTSDNPIERLCCVQELDEDLDELSGLL